MNKTKIPWCDYTINPVKGLCPMACSYCYARKMYLNPYYRTMYSNQEIRYTGMLDSGPKTLPVDSKVFVGSTMELFGDWVKPEWMQEILDYCKMMNRITWIFLTKQPRNLIKWSPFPENVWVGVSATNFEMFAVGLMGLQDVKASVKFFSFEPLLHEISPDKKYAGYNSELMALDLKNTGINWLILGSRTQPTQHPPREWVEEIIAAADQSNIPVFVKEPMASYMGINRKEFPAQSFEEKI